MTVTAASVVRVTSYAITFFTTSGSALLMHMQIEDCHFHFTDLSDCFGYLSSGVSLAAPIE